MKYLQDFPFFSSLTDSELLILDALTEKKKYKKGTTLLKKKSYSRKTNIFKSRYCFKCLWGWCKRVYQRFLLSTYYIH